MDSTSKKILKHVKKNSQFDLEPIDIALSLKMEDRQVEQSLRGLESEGLVLKKEKEGRFFWYPSEAPAGSEKTGKSGKVLSGISLSSGSGRFSGFSDSLSKPVSSQIFIVSLLAAVLFSALLGYFLASASFKDDLLILRKNDKVLQRNLKILSRKIMRLEKK
ncbi:MAG: hypothetical protein ACLFQK_03285 [Fibrobacterota bacterium]